MKKIFFSLLFLCSLIFTCNKVNALSFNCGEKKYNIDESSFTEGLYNYTFVYGNNGSSSTFFYIYSHDDSTAFATSSGGYSFTGNYIFYMFRNGNVEFKSKTSGTVRPGFGKSNLFYCDFDILYEDGTIFIPATNPKVKLPSISNKTEIETGKFDKIVISSGDYNHHGQEKFYLFSYYDSKNVEAIYPRKQILLDGPSNQYFVGADSAGNYIYEVPLFATGVDLVEGNRYSYQLAIMGWSDELQMEVVEKYTDEIFFNIGVVTPEEKEQADRDKQLGLQEENNKTNKGIFDTLKEVLSYINPFSENFFVYKLVELLVNAIKSLFIPSENFFSDWCSDLNDWLSDRLGILYYPIDLVVKFLEKVGQISDSNTAVISWSEFSFMGAALIPAGFYDLNNLVNSNETFKNVHSIYLVFTDVILWIGLLFLAKNTFVDIFGGKYDEIDFVEDVSSAGVRYDNKKLSDIHRANSSLENRRARYNYYDKRRRGQL